MFYLGLCKIWGLPYGAEVNETIILLATLLATSLEVASYTYKKKKDAEVE